MKNVFAAVMAVVLTAVIGWMPVAQAEFVPETIGFKPTVNKKGKVVLMVKDVTAVVTKNAPDVCVLVPDADLYGVDVCVVRFVGNESWFERAKLYVLPVPGQPFTDAWENLEYAIGARKVKNPNVAVKVESCGPSDCYGQFTYVLTLPALTSYGVERAWGWGAINVPTDESAIIWLTDGSGAGYTRTDWTFRVVVWDGREACRWVAYKKVGKHIVPIPDEEAAAYVESQLAAGICPGFLDK